MVVRHLFAKYLYAPVLLIGLNGAALYMMAHNYHYFWLALPILAAIALSLVMERVLPYEEEWNRAHDDVAKDIAHGIVYEAGNLITLGLLLLVSLALPKGSFWPQSLPFLAQFLLALLFADCIMTLIHYLSHRLEWLWKFHAVHHGVHRLYGFNGFVRHPLHQALDVAFGTLPLVLAGLPVPLAAALGVAIAIQLILQHSNVDYRLGPFQKLLSIGPVHRLHHVNWPGVSDVNFGLFLTLWDRLLGTFKLNSDRLPRATDIGIQDCPNFPQIYARQLRVPFEEGFPCGETSAPESAALREDLRESVKELQYVDPQASASQ
jgi:sterol desaturase/sphingolipid hydroxylase (fatty acid hydroxylase superfamily)